MPKDIPAIALIGAGGFAGAHLKALTRLEEDGICRFHSLASRSERGFDRLRERFTIPCTRTDIPELLQQDDLDAVILCTPADTHAPLAIQALEAGKHVLVEKPMADSVEDGIQMVEVAETRDRRLMVGQCLRYMPEHVALRDYLRGGKLGAPRLVRADCFQDAEHFLPPGHPYLDGKKGGGLINSVAVHRLDLLRFLFGEVKRVSAIIDRQSGFFENDAEDTVLANIEFASGLIGQVCASWNARRPPYSEALLVFTDEASVHSIPTDAAQFGELVLAYRDRDAISVGTFPEQFGGHEPIDCRAVAPILPYPDPIANQLLHFVRCCTTKGMRCWSSGADNVNTLGLLEAIRHSAKNLSWTTI